MEYEESLERAIANSPDIAGADARFELPEPELREEGHVTVYENAPETVDRLGREPEHVMKHLQQEFGTSASLDDRGRLRLTGSFDTARVADGVEDYADRFVLCSECGLPDTRLERERGVSTLRCEACGARSAIGE